MPAPYPIERRERAVRAYESGSESYAVVAKRFCVAIRALQRWVQLFRTTWSVEPLPRGGGNPSPIIRCGEVLLGPRPMNWGTSLTMIGALRRRGWITMSTIFGSANSERFVRWARRRLAPKLRRGDVVILDNAPAHKDPRFVTVIEARGARVEFLPPYSPDLNPIEPGWAIAKQHIRAVAPRDRLALRKAAHAGRRRVKRRHCHAWFEHAGYQRSQNGGQRAARHRSRRRERGL